MDYFLAIALGYVLGSLPFGVIVGFAVKGVDVRASGSGKSGTTNVIRTVGVPAGIAVLVLDMGKSVGAVLLARTFSDSAGVEAAAAIAALLGHIWPVFAGFRGGRGTAPGWGGLLVLSPWSALAATIIGLPMVGLSRYVSLGSLVGATVGSATLVALSGAGVQPLPYVWYAAIGWPLVIVLHRENIFRLLRGQERRLGQRPDHARNQA